MEGAFQSTSNRLIEVEYHIKLEFQNPEYKILVGQNHEFNIFETCVFFKFKMDAISSDHEELSSSLRQGCLHFESGKCQLLFMKSFV